MATSQNGWSVLTSPPDATLEWITGRIRPEDVRVIFDYLGERFNSEVEKIRKEWSWGWAYRAIRGASSGYSNHASGTATDFNAPAHPLGVRGTFSQHQIDRCHKILRDLEGVVRWGEDYVNRKDGMHFEIVGNAAKVHRIANKIRNKQMPDQKVDWEPDEAKAVHFGRTQEQFLIAAGAQRGQIRRLNGVALIQQALNRANRAGLKVDGRVGTKTLNAWGRWEDRVGGMGRPRVPDRKSVDELVRRSGIRLVGTPWDD